MKFPDIETGAQLLLGFRAQLANFELAHFVRESLPRPRDVAVYLGYGLVRSMLFEIINRLLAGPAHGMNARVHYQTHGAEALTRELPEAAGGIAIDTHLQTERLGVEAPALDICAVAVEPAEIGNP